MVFTFVYHSCFVLDTSQRRIVVDPFFQNGTVWLPPGNPDLPVPPGGKPSIGRPVTDIFLSHAHGDHVGGLSALCQLYPSARVAGVFEVTNYVTANMGISNPVMGYNRAKSLLFMDLDQEDTFDVVAAAHSSSFPDGTYGGVATGLVWHIDGKSVYYAGDTAVTMDMQLLQSANLDVAILPVGGFYTMNYQDAEQCATMIGCNTVIGVHFDTFPAITIDKAAAVQYFASRGKTLILPSYGQQVTI